MIHNNSQLHYHEVYFGYSSFKIAGVQMRGKTAAQLQLFYMAIMAVVFLAVFGVRLLVFLAWMLWLPFVFMIDFLVGFIRGLTGQFDREEQK